MSSNPDPQYDLLASIWPSPGASATSVMRVRLESVPILIEDMRQALVREDYPEARHQAETLLRWLKAVECSAVVSTGP